MHLGSSLNDGVLVNGVVFVTVQGKAGGRGGDLDGRFGGGMIRRQTV